MELCKDLSGATIPYVYLRGEMAQDKRIEAIRRFTNNEVKILLATDVAARGLDIVDITHVINFDLPRYADVYVHRIGRTARAGRKGVAINLIEAHDVQQMERIERYTGESVDVRVIDALRPQHKIADFTKKKKKNKVKEEKQQKHVKQRLAKQKNKGKPDLLAKKIRKLQNDGKSEEEIAKILAARALEMAKVVTSVDTKTSSSNNKTKESLTPSPKAFKEKAKPKDKDSYKANEHVRSFDSKKAFKGKSDSGANDKERTFKAKGKTSFKTMKNK